MEEEIKKKMEEHEERISYLESRIKKLIGDCTDHKHNKSDGHATLNY